MRFNPGQFGATPAALATVPQSSIIDAIARHVEGDWGDVSEAEKRANNRALRDGERLLSAYHAKSEGAPEREVKFWIITEADRSATTVLLPSEY